MAQVRRAGLRDASAIAAVHAASWQSTYRDVLPAEFLNARNRQVREAFWTTVLGNAESQTVVFVACDDEGFVCGFAACGPERSGTLNVAAELYSLYLLDGAKGLGIGRQLVQCVRNELRGQPLAVWVLGVNPARGFYEHLGGRLMAQREAVFGGVTFTEVAYDLGTC